MNKIYLQVGLAALMIASPVLSHAQKATRPSTPKNEKLTVVEQKAVAAQTIATDLTVQGSACIGFDCNSNESFGFSTIRLKENNLRIEFDDTSASASFPNTDWEIQANETSNGGANKLSIVDRTSGRTPFTVEASAPNHSLYVDDGGRIGIGTSTPVVELHMPDGDTPTIRLEQDGSSGFTPQTWDMAGNEANFFIRDVTNGSSLPFRIKPGAQGDAIFIADQNVYMKGAILPRASLPSDKRLKNNINSFHNAGNLLNQLSAVTFNYDLVSFPNYGFEGGTQYGLIAQEVEKVLPQYVNEVSFPDGKRYKTVNYIGLIPILLQTSKEQIAINKEQQEEIERLKEKITKYETLESRLTSLEAKLEENEINEPLKTDK